MKKAYEIIGGSEPSLGILLSYPGIEINKTSRKVSLKNTEDIKKTYSKYSNKKLKVSFIGSGNYATSVLIPAFKDAGANLKSIASNAGVSSVHAGKKFGFDEAITDSELLFKDDSIDTVVITTRHNSHAEFVLRALKAKKNIFVEKPLCLTLDELDTIQANYSSSNILMVGFNRRFAPQVKKIKNLLNDVRSPKALVLTINAGVISDDHWTQDLEVGGGRIIGEACHFIDLLVFLVGKKITNYQINYMENSTRDTATIQLNFEDGSIGTINYFSNGSKSFPKERLEVFAEGGVLVLDNYLKLNGYGWPGFKKMNLWQQDKGQKACVKAFIDTISKGNIAPISIEDILEVSRVSIKLANN